MRVLLVSHEASMTGAPRVAVDLLDAFSAAGAHSTVWHRWGGPMTGRLDRAADATVRQPLNRTRAHLRRVSALRGVADRLDRWGVRRTIARTSPDLIWCNTTNTVAVAAEAKASGIPTVLHVHEESDWAAARLAAAPTAARSARLVACSTRAASVVADAFDLSTDDVTVITSAVDVDRLVAASAGFEPHEQPVVIGCGTADRRKGFDVFVAAARRAADDGDRARWRWVGAADSSVSSGPVEMLGERPDAAAEIAGASVFTLPSREDPFPLVVLEAMALGRPVVVSDLPGPVEQVGDAGVVIPVAEPDSLATAVRELLDDPERRADLGRRAHDRCRDRWDVSGFRSAVQAVLADEVRMRRVVVLHALTGLAEGGGVQTVVRQLASNAPPGRLDVHVVTTRPADRSGDLCELPITLHPLDYTGGPYRPIDRIRLMLGVARQVRRVRPGVVHLHSGIAWLGLAARVVALRTRFVLEVHDAPGSGRHGRLTDRVEGWWVRYLGAVAVCHSTAVEADVRRLWKAADSRIVRFPLGVDTERFRPVGNDARTSIRRSIGVDEDAFVAVAIGRLAASKRFGDAVEAIAACSQRSSSVHLLVVGGSADDPAAADLRARAAALDVESFVHVIGERHGDALAAVLGASDVLVSTSEYEGFGLAVVEAMSAGIPVIATGVGGVNDLVVAGDTGLLVDVGDVEAIADELRRLVDDPTRAARLGGNARERAVGEFGVGRATEAFLELYGRGRAR